MLSQSLSIALLHIYLSIFIIQNFICTLEVWSPVVRDILLSLAKSLSGSLSRVSWWYFHVMLTRKSQEQS